MTGQPEKLKLVCGWVKKAENDLINAEHTLTLEEDACPLDTVCFHAQQCAEKYLKALLTHYSVSFPKIHDIGELVLLLPEDTAAPPLDEHEQDLLTDFVSAGRYPGDWEDPTRSETDEALTAAKKVRDFARQLLPKEALDIKTRSDED